MHYNVIQDLSVFGLARQNVQDVQDMTPQPSRARRARPCRTETLAENAAARKRAHS